ncbi:MFS transporter [Salinispora vitiensis]|uniref:hypothetical protein n=1 Tax=Salinispora vitiensis TaxID=999544 RepID=UPI000367AECE|nr:hypothetical protein [Salinispora vitiensis]
MCRSGLAELKYLPGVVRESVLRLVRPGNLRLILVTGLAIGVGIGAVEAFWQPALAALLPDPSAATTFAVAVGGFLFIYLCLELRAPLSQTLLHSASPTGRRASILSTYSMSTSTGAVIASVGLGAVVDRIGVTAVWLCAAAVVAGASVAYLRLTPTLGRPDDRGASAVEPAVSR